MNRDSITAGLRGSGTGGLLEGARQALDELRHPDRRAAAAPAPHHADARRAVLLALATAPATGYEIVRGLAADGDDDAPGAGEVYPALQLLAAEGLATATDVDGRRRWALTGAGEAAAEAARAHVDRAEEAPAPPARRGTLTRSAAQLAQAVALVAQTGTPAQVAEAAAVLDDARRRLLTVLSRP